MLQDNTSQIEEKIDFLQSEEWRKFQESTGKRTFRIDGINVIEHKLPIVGNYFYVPRWPMTGIMNYKLGVNNIIELAKKEEVGWIRIDPENEEVLNLIKKSTERFRPRQTGLKIQKAPHDMQPKEIFVIDIAKSEEELLSEMKSKTRYNIKIAQKRGISVQVISNFQFLPPQWDPAKAVAISNQARISNDKDNKYYYVDKFIELVNLTAKRKGVSFHPGNYYKKMFEIIPREILRLYCAKYNGKIIAANLVVFFGDSAIYLHGATDDEYRNVMAPYLLQWQAILDAKEKGCKYYDFGGVKIPQPATHNPQPDPNKKVTSYKLQAMGNSWSGITKFKLGFSEKTQPTEFLGSYDIILNNQKYFLYRILQKMKNFI